MKRWMVILIAYGLAGTAALVVLQTLDGRGYHPLLEVLMASVVATFVVFGFSMFTDNSSIYDPYWSVAPIVIAMWLASDLDAVAPLFRQLLVVALTFAWGARLTYSWARRWKQLDHEDWRYANIRARSGLLYWPASLLGIHLFPTLMTFLGCLPMWYALTVGDAGFGLLDIAAIVVTGSAILIESSADKQLFSFVDSKPAQGAILDSGLWGWSRHPNYFGEMLFWWGIALFGVAAAPGQLWPLVGAGAITLMFVVVSLPMIEARMRARRTDWDAYAQRVPLLIPRPPRGPNV